MTVLNHNNEVPAGLWTFDIEKVPVFHSPVSRSTPAYTDYQPKTEVYSQGSAESAENWVTLHEHLTAYLQSGNDSPFAREAIMTDQNGTVFFLFLIGQITERNSDGVASRMEGTYLDISGQKHIQAEFNRLKSQTDLPLTRQKENEILPKEKQQLLSTFLKNCPAIVAMVDREMKYLAVTDAWKSQFKLESFNIEGQSHYELFPDISPVWRQYHQRGMAGETIRMEEDTTVGTGGHTEWMQWEIRPWYDDAHQIGGIIIFILMVSDKHAAKQMLIQAKDQAEQSAEIKSRFLSVMSHEMRTPLNGVIGFINLLLHDPRPDQLENMNVLKFSAENLLVLINNVLDFSKLDAEKVELEEAGFDLRNLVENITASLKLEASAKHLELLSFSDNLIPNYITGDSARLGQVLINLLSNAIKFTQSGSVSLKISVVSQDEKATTIAFAIEDTGIGIPDKIQDKIFDNFSQADPQTTRRYGGTGLGLTISKRIVQLMGGSIDLDSQPGQGSVFSFKINFLNFDEAGPKTIDEIHMASHTLQNAKILIAEDYPINILVVKKFLQQWNCLPSVAENGLVAFEMVQKEDFDLILMDLQMPVMDGYEATARIRSLHGKKYADLPIIALTASSIVDRETKIFQAGMNGLISKPFVPQELRELLVWHLSRK